MLLTNAQMYDSLIVLAQAEETGVLGFAIAQNRHKLADEVKEYAAKRDELLKEHGTETEPGVYSIKTEAIPAFSAALKPYADMTTDVAVRQVPEEIFCSGSLTSAQMFTLAWMVKEGE